MSFFGGLANREKAAADMFRQMYGLYHGGMVSHDPAQVTGALGGLQNDWEQMKGQLPPQSFAPNPPNPLPQSGIQRGAIAAAMPGK